MDVFFVYFLTIFRGFCIYWIFFYSDSNKWVACFLNFSFLLKQTWHIPYFLLVQICLYSLYMRLLSYSRCLRMFYILFWCYSLIFLTQSCLFFNYFYQFSSFACINFRQTFLNSLIFYYWSLIAESFLSFNECLTILELFRLWIFWLFYLGYFPDC